MKRKTILLAMLSLCSLSYVNAQQSARIQVIHNSADAAVTEVDVYLNDELLLDNFKFRTATAFIDAPAGFPLTLEVAPSTSTSSAQAIYETTQTLEANKTYVAVADGIVSTSGYEPSKPFGLEFYDMGRESATTATTTDVLVHHGATDAPMVDVNEVTGPSVLVDNVSYPEFSSYLELPTADYTINISTADGATVVQTYSAPLAALGLEGAAVSVVASGFLDPSNNSDGPAFGLWVALASGGDLVELPIAPLSTEKFAFGGFSVYPNPSSTTVTIAVDKFENASAKILDVFGRTVKNIPLVHSKTSINVSEFQSGWYFVHMYNANNGGISNVTKLRVK